MRSKLAGFLLILSLMALALPASAPAQDREGYGGYVRRDKNGVRIGDDRIVLFDGPGVLNYHRKHRWMSGAGGAATVIGVGAGAGAATGAIVKGKKGAVVGALVGAGAATGIWLYKNRTEKRRIF